MTRRGLVKVSGMLVILAMLAGAALWKSQWAALAIEAAIRFCT